MAVNLTLSLNHVDLYYCFTESKLVYFDTVLPPVLDTDWLWQRVSNILLIIPLSGITDAVSVLHSPMEYTSQTDTSRIHSTHYLLRLAIARNFVFSSEDKCIYSSLDSLASVCTVTWKMELTTCELDTLCQPFIDGKLLVCYSITLCY